MEKYISPDVELIEFDDDIVLSSQSGTCRCYADVGVKNDYSAVDSGCWSDSVGASEILMHDGSY